MGQTNTQISVWKFTLHSVQYMVAKVIDASMQSLEVQVLWFLKKLFVAS